jgi:hypothetical protein
MADELLSVRTERLEKTVEGLQILPAEVAALGDRVGSVETQIVQLRAEMRVEFSDVRSEMRTEFAAVRGEMQTGLASVKTELRQEIRAEVGALRKEMHEGFAGARDDMLVGLANVTNELRREIRESAEEGQRHSRILFEEVLSRIAALGEHHEGSPGRKPRGPLRKR